VLALGAGGLLARLVERQGDERVDRGLALRDPRGERVDDLDRAEAPCGVAGPELQRGG
jgi:hypothetical protein